MTDVIDIQIAKSRIAANLRYCMADRGVSQTDLAHAVGVSIPTIHRLRDGVNDSAFTVVARVADYFHVSTDDMMLPAADFKRTYQVKSKAFSHAS